MDIVYEDKEISSYLNAYIDWRVQFMKRCLNSGDEIGNNEIMGDEDFTFPYKEYETIVGNG